MMLKMVITVAGWMFATGAFAQAARPVTPRLDPSQAGKPVLASPNLKVLKPADIYISRVSLTSITKNPSCGCYVVTVGVEVQNHGEMPTSSITVLKAWYHQSVAGEFKAPAAMPPMANDPNHGAIGPWTPCAAEPKLPVVGGNSVWNGSLTYEVNFDDVTAGRKFYFLVAGDFYNNTKESNEGNNYSAAIFVTPPAH